MNQLDDFKKTWKEVPNDGTRYIDMEKFMKEVRLHASRQVSKAIQYFWASFAYQLIVYALLVHTAIKNFTNFTALILAIGGVAMFIPFTYMLVKRFKAVARSRATKANPIAIRNSISHQRNLLVKFYTFKRRYELLLLPAITAIAVLLIFLIHVPGTLSDNIIAIAAIFVVALGVSIAAVVRENRKHFKKPIADLTTLLNEFQESDEQQHT
jgi:uncharacterized membrane protein YhaH (DUF805 family)